MRNNITLSNDIRKIICQKYEVGKSAILISEDLEIKYKTVISVIRKFKTTSKFDSEKSKAGRKKY
jgi:transposase